MTYCLAIKVEEGLICLADGRITAGTQVSVARKVVLQGPAQRQLAIMTSGLRSLRDKTLAYFEREQVHRAPNGFESLLDAVDVYCGCLRRVEKEDAEALEHAKLPFNLHTLLCGQLPEDRRPSIFLIYPEGNWIQVDERTPYLSIGATTYGKPILDRALRHQTSLANALKLAYLSFDSTRYSSADVGYPIDLLTFSPAERLWRGANYDYDDLRAQRLWWNDGITRLAAELPPGPWETSLMPSGSTGTPT